MIIFKKTIAVIFMILSVLAMIAMIVGLFGSWVVKAQVEATGTQLLLAGETAIATTRDGLVRVDGLLDSSSQFVGEVDSRIQSLSSNLATNEEIVIGVLQRVNENIVPTIQQAAETFRVIESNLLAINDAIDAVKGIPVLGLSANIPQASRLDDALVLMDNLRSDALAVRDMLQSRREELVEGRFQTLLESTSNLSTRITDSIAKLAEADERLAETEAAMRDLRQRLPAILTTITIVLNLLFLLSLLAFMSLFIHAWSYFKCTEDGLRALLPPEECGATPSTS